MFIREVERERQERRLFLGRFIINAHHWLFEEEAATKAQNIVVYL